MWGDGCASELDEENPFTMFVSQIITLYTFYYNCVNVISKLKEWKMLDLKQLSDFNSHTVLFCPVLLRYT